MNYVSRKVITVTNDTYITAAQVCELLRKVAEQYAGKDIHLVLDNARYQKCKVVTALAEELGVSLEYLPPYSPYLEFLVISTFLACDCASHGIRLKRLRFIFESIAV